MDKKEEKITMAYLAGALDGDGSFSFIKKRDKRKFSPNFYPLIQLMNRHPNIPTILKEYLGGSCNWTNSKESFQWKVEKRDKCINALEKICPYLVIKKRRAFLLLEFLKQNPRLFLGGKKISKEILDKREDFYLEMKKMNLSISDKNKKFKEDISIFNEKEIFWSYMAGLFDTDGSFSIKMEKPKKGCISPLYSGQILISITDRKSIDLLYSKFKDGSFFSIKAPTRNGKCFRFSIRSANGIKKFISNLLPYLNLKNKRAQCLLDFCENITPTKYCRSGIPEEEIQLRERYYNQMLLLNKNGVYKPSLIDLETLTDKAEGDRAEGHCAAVNVASEKASKEDAVL